MMEIEVLSLFPEYMESPLQQSMLARAIGKGLISVEQVNIRDFAEGRHSQVDDRPFGGGPGMVMMAEPVVKAIRAKRRPKSRVVYLSPQGERLTAARCAQLAQEEHLILLCGHYEGIDERALQEIDEELSIGDFVLTSGLPAALCLIDALARFVPGVLGHEEAAHQDSFEDGLLDCPHYTRPAIFEGRGVPQVLLNGNHAEIERWRLEQRIEKTRRVRPELEVVEDGDEINSKRTAENDCNSGRHSDAACAEI